MVRILLIAMLGLALSVPQGLMMGDAYSKSDTGGANKGSGKGKADKGGSKQVPTVARGPLGKKQAASQNRKVQAPASRPPAPELPAAAPKGNQERQISQRKHQRQPPGQGCGQASFWWFRFGNTQPRQARGVGKPYKGDCVTDR